MSKLAIAGASFPLRLVFAISVLAIAILLWMPIVYSKATPTPSVLAAGIGVVMLGFLGLGFLRGTDRALAPLKATLIVAIAGCLLVSVEMRASRTSATSHLMAAFIVILSVATLLLADERPRIAYGLAVVLSLTGAYALYAVMYYAAIPSLAPVVRGSGLLVSIMGSATLAAAWHGRVLLTSATANGQ